MNKNYIRKKMAELRGGDCIELKGNSETPLETLMDHYHEIRNEMGYMFNIEWSHDKKRVWITRGRLKCENKTTRIYKQKIKDENSQY